MKNKNLSLLLLTLTIIIGIFIYTFDSWLLIPFCLIFTILIPGFLINLNFKSVSNISWTTFVYSLGLGIVSFMVESLIINTIGLTIGDYKPLSVMSLTLGNIILVTILCIRYKHWGPIAIKPIKIHLRKIEQALLITCNILLILFIIGAILLNNGATGIVSFACFMATPVLFIILFWKSNKISNGVLLYLLWTIALGILLSGWLRSWYVSGPDISLEYRLAEAVRSSNYWSLDIVKNAYNACASVILFAPSLSIITKTTTLVTFKFIIPVVYSFIVPVIYLIFKNIFNNKRGAILAAIFFMSQPVFVVWWWIPIRQQIAFLLFAIIILIMTKVGKQAKKSLILVTILSVGLIMAHYTTALIAIAFFIIYWLSSSILARKKIIKNFHNPISIKFILIFGVAFFIWYAQLTYGFSEVAKTISKGITNTNISHIFSSNASNNNESSIQSTSNSAKDRRSTFELYGSNKAALIREKYGETNMYSNQTTKPYITNLVNNGLNDNNIIQGIRQIVIAISKILVVACVVVSIWLARKKKIPVKYVVMSSSALVLLGAGMVMPSFSVSYDLVRTYQQCLISMTVLYCFIIIAPKKFRPLVGGLLISFVAVYFILVSNTLSFIVGTSSVPANLSNSGSEYTYRYVNKSDILMGDWLNNNSAADSSLSGDGLSRDRLRLTLSPKRSQAMLNTILPATVPKYGYIIMCANNTATIQAFDTYENDMFIYNYPIDFLTDNKNVVYSNSSSMIFK